MPISDRTVLDCSNEAIYGFITHVDDNDRAETTTNSFSPHLDWLLN